ncbi:MAG: 4Fe-4S cluster-binding domain-containing protein [Bacillota bacterium]
MKYNFRAVWKDHKGGKLKLLRYSDILIDGRFLAEKKRLDLPYRGSSNQRIIYFK